jgi:type IV pilus assembly protein PilY1
MSRTFSTRFQFRLALLLGIAFCATSAIAATADLANSPLSNAGGVIVKPNLMFILDASGSMDRDYMPDSVNGDPACKDTGGSLQNCNFADPPYNSSTFNGIYYDPATTYTPAVNFDGTSRTSYTAWTAVPNDAYGVQFTGTINLTAAYPDNVWCSTSSPSVAERTPPFTATTVCRLPIQGGVWTYPNGTHNRKSAVAGTRNPYYYTISSLSWCSTKNAAGFGNGTCQAKKTATYQYPKYGTASDGFSRVDIVPGTANYPRVASRTDCTGAVGPTGCTYAQEMTNFANWYAYYRTRMQMMKTASGLAFKQINDSFRVGFITINPNALDGNGDPFGPVVAAKFLGVSDFTAGAGGQKDKWYTKFYAQDTNNSTPLREALSRVGRYYANIKTGINDGITDDPVQYSCQQNYALLSTDGFWNGNAGQKLDGTAIGHQDSDPAVAPRPILDGPLKTTVVKSDDTLTQQVCTSNGAIFGTTCGCAGADLGKSRVKQQTTSTITTTVSINGVLQSTTPSSATTYQNITGCMAQVTTTDTPTTIVDSQSVVANGATTFAAVNGVAAGANTTGTCGANFGQVVTRTTVANSRVVTTGTLAAAPVLSATYSFNYGACVALTNAVVTRFTVIQEQTLTANGASSFGAISGTSAGPSISGVAGGSQTNGTCAANQARVWRRTSTYDQTATTIGSAATTYSFTAPAYGAAVAVGAGCANLTTVTSVTETAQNVCTGGTNTTYPAAGNGLNSQSACGVCAAGSTVLKQRVWNYTKTVVGAGAPTFTNGTPVAPSHTVVTACSVSPPVKVVAATITNNVVTSVTGAPVAATPPATTSVLSNTTIGGPVAPASTSTPGIPTSSSTGANASAADFTISPNPTTTTSTTSTSVAVGYADTLADVAQYYYNTDLRGPGSMGAPVGTPLTAQDVGTVNNVKGQPNTDVQNDIANWQHMTTFTLGLGVDGTLTYKDDYRSLPTGDFLAIKNGTLNWPPPVENTPTAVDDLWHAAVNGRGIYFSARNPTQLANGLSTALTSITARDGSASAAATSNLEPIAGDNYAYIASYRTQFWDGDLEARTIDPVTGVVSIASVWSARDKLDTLAAATTPGGANRNIKFRDPVSGSLLDFTWANLSPTLKGYFTSGSISSLSQWPGIVAAGQVANAEGQNLVNFLRGDSTYESQYYRLREHILGDIVNGAPVFVKTAQADYIDTGYLAPAGANFKECVNSGGAACGAIFNGPRAPTVYVSSNDGMLHAFDASNTGGAERWAYIPSLIMPKLYRLAERNYASNHEYFVDGSPTLGDFYDTAAGKWKTLLVAGLRKGGRGYYALDVTDPANPIAMWEFNVRATASCPSATLPGDKDDCDLGFTYGNPIITKLANGTWVVVVTSGYNNVSPGDGKGYLYVLNPATGAVVKKIQAANAVQSLSPGDTTTPSGLSRINAWIDNAEVNNTTLKVYGGDLLGNLWRFNLDAGTAYSIAKLTDPLGVPQSVTTAPELADVNGKDMVYVATGRYLGVSDILSAQRQTVYGIKDETNGTVPVTPINARGATVIAQTLTPNPLVVGTRNVTAYPVDLTVKDGWRVDLPDTGERVNVEPKLILGTLIVASNVPTPSVCEPSGSSWLNGFDYRTGGYIVSTGSQIASVNMKGMVVGISIVVTSDGQVVGIVVKDDDTVDKYTPPIDADTSSGRRSSWREIR